MDRIVSGNKSKTRKIIWYASAATAMALLIFSFSLFRGKRVTASIQRITIAEAEYSSFQEFIPLNGTVQPLKTIYIDAIEGGRVEEIFAEDGKPIEVGQSIIRLSNQQFQMDAINREAQLLDQQNNLLSSRLQMDQQAAQLREQLNETEYNLIESEREWQTNKRLYADSAISKNEFEASKEKLNYLRRSKKLLQQKIINDSLFRLNQVNRVESSLSLIDQNIQFLDETVKSLIVRAPLSGQLSQLQVELGQTIGAGARIGQIDVMNGFKIRSSVPEHYVSRISPGLTATFTLSGTEYTLVVNKVYPEIVAGQFEIDLVFNGEVPANIHRGQTLQLRLVLGSESQAIKIPRGAFFQKTGGHWIYVLESDQKAVKRSIELGRQNADYYEVRTGLQNGEKIIVSSYDSFGDAEEVIIEQ